MIREYAFSIEHLKTEAWQKQFMASKALQRRRFSAEAVWDGQSLAEVCRQQSSSAKR